jgi:hypothetical protein
MHPEITRELSRALQQESLERNSRAAAELRRERAAAPVPRERRRHGAFSALRLMARLQPRGH